MTSADTSADLLRIRLRQPRNAPNLQDFGGYFSDVESVLIIGALIDRRPFHKSVSRDEQLEWWKEFENNVADFRVARSSYNSPLEIVLVTGGGIGTVATAGTVAWFMARGALNVWGGWNRRRVEHAKANVELAELQIRQDYLDALSNALNMPDDYEDESLLPLRRRLFQAIRVLPEIESIIVEPDTDMDLLGSPLPTD